ncbi:hypothetical protein ACA910_006129 [Epithemia clementina (nom. ined.)]
MPNTTPKRRIRGSVVALLFMPSYLTHSGGAWAFYWPGVKPKYYVDGEEVQLQVNKLTSTKSFLPKDYYSLPFCAPPNNRNGKRRRRRKRRRAYHDNIGELLQGDRIQSSPYRLYFRRDMFCEQLCLVDLGAARNGGGHNGQGQHQPVGQHNNKLTTAIQRQYHNNWIVDNMNAAGISHRDEDGSNNTLSVNYSNGFPIGFVDDNRAYIHNHVNIQMEYQRIESSASDNVYYDLVGFGVEPLSIRHELEWTKSSEQRVNHGDAGGGVGPPVANILNPIPSCNLSLSSGRAHHTKLDQTTATGRAPQEASGVVLFTYDVIWVENQNPDLKWANRWEPYLLANKLSPSFRYFSIQRKLITMIVLSAMLAAAFLTKALREPRHGY